MWRRRRRRRRRKREKDRGHSNHLLENQVQRSVKVLQHGEVHAILTATHP
jgi:hypothetical protein